MCALSFISAFPLFIDMLESLVKYLLHMVIVQGITDGPAVSPVPDQARLLEDTQLV